MKKLSFIMFLLFVLLAPVSHVIAQDTISTAGVEFSDTKPAAPATNKTELKTADSSKIQSPGAVTSGTKNKETSLWAIFIAGLLGGFAALLMPCIFTMLPMTVSFFTNGSAEKGKVAGKAMIYGLSIIVIYVVLGLAITVCF